MVSIVQSMNEVTVHQARLVQEWVTLLHVTHTHPFNGPFVRDYPSEPVPER